ncbi:ribose 5-phosphate isomerase A [Candidatus Methanoprimaticola sp. MG2]|uniref:ribose 5-phosphate isomerase A n=1 Tax=Candidatus Methanoprimaticola sp. MG2 TaxID=3228838 RepID=UPI0039C5F8D7
MTLEAAEMKRIVAETAVDAYVKDGMNVGLGTGSTAYYAIKRIGQLVNENGYDLTCVATSVQSEDLARECGITVVDIDDVKQLDVTIDGADEVDPKLNLIKGLGGALLREKIVAAATVQEIIVADESKLVEKLGTKAPLPVEVLQFGNGHTSVGLRRQRCEPVMRMKDGRPFVTDGGNYIYDCRFPDGIDNPFFIESRIDVIPGVIENGLFLNTAFEVLICDSDGNVRRMSEEKADE